MFKELFEHIGWYSCGLWVVKWLWVMLRLKSWRRKILIEKQQRSMKLI